MNLSRGGDRLDLHAQLMSETNSRLLKLIGIRVQLAWSRSWHV